MFDLIVILIPGLPLLAALANGVNALLGERYSRILIPRLAWGAALGSFLGTLYVLASVLIDPAPREVVVYRWLSSGALNVDVAFLIDSLSALMMLLTTSLGFAMTFFSVNYMHNERGFSRFFTVISLFLFAMLTLVMANNFVLLFLGWELVGMCSYLLISFYCERPSAAQAGTRAFVMNRIGDAGFLVAIFLLFATFGSADFREVFSRTGEIDPGVITAISLCLLLAAIAKSGQFPLGTWLPRAMEGPTPSSALFYGSVMVTAGVYLIVRSHVFYDHAPNALLLVAIAGAATALFAGLTSMVQTDIKNMLLATSNAQIGLMFLACGFGAYPVAVFHLLAHAYLKCYQFITAPSILHLLHGGPDVTIPRGKDTPPVISWLVLAGALALVIFPFLARWLPALRFGSGAMEILFVVLALGGIAAFAAAFNSARLTSEAFEEAGHGEHANDHPKKLPGLFVKPLLVMAVLAAIGYALGMLPGGINGSWFQQLLAPVVAAQLGMPVGHSLLTLVLMGLMVLLVFAGWLTPLYFDRFRLEPAAGAVSPTMQRLYNLTLNRFWLDEFYDVAVVAPATKLARLLDRFDLQVIDRLTGGVPAAAPRIRAIGQTWQEQFLAMQAAEAAAPAGAPGRAATRWEESDERAALAAAQAQVLGRVPAAGFVASRWMALRRITGGLAGGSGEVVSRASGWVEQEAVGGTENLFGRLLNLVSGASAWFERRVIGSTEKLFGRGTELASTISGWFEKRIIGRVEDLFGSVTELAAAISHGVESFVFQKGVQGGIPITGEWIGRVLTRTEDFLGHPLVIALIFFLSIIALLAGVL
ncbi:MAG: NADH-quinone oxidoreductase subunit L [Chthoniobacterales bacterium]|nr:NADH-quinone oxidoreductase subunit L [Chthoniobacterales bacterium]